MFGDLLHIKPMIWICELPIHLLHILVMVFVMAVRISNVGTSQ